MTNTNTNTRMAEEEELEALDERLRVARLLHVKYDHPGEAAVVLGDAELVRLLAAAKFAIEAAAFLREHGEPMRDLLGERVARRLLTVPESEAIDAFQLLMRRHERSLPPPDSGKGESGG